MQGGFPNTGTLPRGGSPCWGCAVPTPGQQMGLSNTAERHATFLHVCICHLCWCSRRRTCPGIKHTPMFSFTLKTVQVLSAQAALIEHHRLGDLNNQDLFSHSFGSPKPRIKVRARSLPPEASLLRLQTAVFSMSSHVLSSVRLPGVPSS